MRKRYDWESIFNDFTSWITIKSKSSVLVNIAGFTFLFHYYIMISSIVSKAKLLYGYCEKEEE